VCVCVRACVRVRVCACAHARVRAGYHKKDTWVTTWRARYTARKFCYKARWHM